MEEFSCKYPGNHDGKDDHNKFAQHSLHHRRFSLHPKDLYRISIYINKNFYYLIQTVNLNRKV